MPPIPFRQAPLLSTLAQRRLLPAEIAALVRILTDFNRAGTPEHKANCERLEAGSGCCARQGKMVEAHSAARSAIPVCCSIWVELPINYPRDGDAILATLAYTGWRLPRYRRQRAAERMARFVTARPGRLSARRRRADRVGHSTKVRPATPAAGLSFPHVKLSCPMPHEPRRAVLVTAIGSPWLMARSLWSVGPDRYQAAGVDRRPLDRLPGEGPRPLRPRGRGRSLSEVDVCEGLTFCSEGLAFCSEACRRCPRLITPSPCVHMAAWDVSC